MSAECIDVFSMRLRTNSISFFKPRGYFMYHQKPYVIPEQIMCFVWISEKKTIISLHSVDWLLFITETDGVFCAVPTGSFLRERFVLKGLNYWFL